MTCCRYAGDLIFSRGLEARVIYHDEAVKTLHIWFGSPEQSLGFISRLDHNERGVG